MLTQGKYVLPLKSNIYKLTRYGYHFIDGQLVTRILLTDFIILVLMQLNRVVIMLVTVQLGKSGPKVVGPVCKMTLRYEVIWRLFFYIFSLYVRSHLNNWVPMMSVNVKKKSFDCNCNSYLIMCHPLLDFRFFSLLFVTPLIIIDQFLRMQMKSLVDQLYNVS